MLAESSDRESSWFRQRVLSFRVLPLFFFLVWILGGIVSLFGALSVAELGAAMPRAGGQYVYLNEAYGPIWGYLYGWSAVAVINTASIAAVGVAFSEYLGFFFPIGDASIKGIYSFKTKRHFWDHPIRFGNGWWNKSKPESDFFR